MGAALDFMKGTDLANSRSSRSRFHWLNRGSAAGHFAVLQEPCLAGIGGGFVEEIGMCFPSWTIARCLWL